MVFSSLAFLFIFLPATLAAYHLVPTRYRNVVLLVSSLVFYAWGGPRYLPLLAGEALVSWALALLIQTARTEREKSLLLALECVVLLGLLAFFKYTGFILANVQALTGGEGDVFSPVLPIGISFYTFQLISYVADVRRGTVAAQPRYWKLLLYCSCFHQCIAGPIVRYETVANEIDHRSATANDVYLGVRRFCCGLAKKAVLANSCANVADALIPVGALGPQSVSGYWLGMVFYTLQIYLDFSAYSDMAIGLGRMVGFHYLENFDHPYQAHSVQDFWRRWHISLSSFFRDYVYIPLGGSRCSTPAYVRNMAVVWLLTGLWHGASWNYVLWGAYYLAFLLFEKFVVRGRMPRVLGHPFTLLVVMVGWVLFRFENFGELGQVLAGMVGIGAKGLTSLSVRTTLLQNAYLLVLSIVACTGLGTWLHRTIGMKARSNEAIFTAYSIGEMVLPAVLLLVSVVALAGASYNPFIYFQF